MTISLGRYWSLLKRYLLPLWPKALLLTLLLGAAIGLQLYSPMILQRFIDAALQGASSRALTGHALLFLGLALGIQLLQVGSAYVSRDLGWRATNELRSELTRHTLGLDLEFHKARTPGEMIERVDGDVTVLANFFSQFTVLVLSNVVLLGGVLVVLWSVDWRAGLALTLFALGNLAVLQRTRNAAMPGWQAARQASGEYLGFLGERLAGLEDLRANGAAPFTMNQFYGMMRQRLQAELKAGRGMAVTLIATFGMVAVGLSLAMGAGAYLVSIGAISVGMAYLLVHYAELLRRPVEQIVGQVQDLTRASASIARISELLQTHSAIPDGPGAPLPAGPLAVDVAGVSFGYGAGQPMLRQLSFSVAPGQVLGVLGRTGSGKSTVARLLARLCDPGEGAVRLGGVDLRQVRLADLRQRVGVVSQDVQLFAGSVRDNLTLFDPTVSDDRIWAALSDLGLGTWVESLPAGLDTELAAGGGLSAGEAQLLALARVFLSDPGLVILDEPSSRLDPVTEHRLEQALDGLLRSRTAIVIAHRLATLRRADQVLVLEAGAIAEHGAREALAADPASRFAQLLQSEAIA